MFRLFLSNHILPGLFFETPPAVPPTPPPAAPQAPVKKEGDEKPKVTHTQEELDALFTDRAKRGGQAALDELFKALNVKDAEEAKSMLAEGKKLKDSQLSELDKAKADQKTAEDALTAEKNAHSNSQVALTERLLKAELQAEARKAGFRDESLDDVWLLVKSEHRDKITEKDEKFEGIAAVVEAIKKARPFWLAEGDGKKPKTPGSPRSQRKAGDGTEDPPKKGPFKTL